MFAKLSLSAALIASLGLGATAASTSAAGAADIDVYRVGPPPYYAAPSRVVVVTPGPHCYVRIRHVWVAGTLVTRRVRRCI